MAEENVVGSTQINPNEKKQQEAMKAARENYEQIENVPDGYIEAKLSTLGKVGAPASFYIRNFSPEDIANLGLSDDHDLPIRVLKVMDSLIWNPQDSKKKISVKDFHEKEVIETLLLIYETFYTEVFPNQTWELTEEDDKFLKEQCGGDTDSYREKIRSLENGEWKPTFDLNIAKDLDYYDITDKEIFKVARISRDYNGKPFTASFSMPKYGDFLKLKYFIDDMYRKEDAKFARIGEIIQFRENAKEDIKKGKNIDLNKITNIPESEYEAYKEYEDEKTLFSITASKALYLQELNGKDLSNLPLDEKLLYARDPRLDYSTFKQIQDKFNEQKFGYKEEITAFDPIMQKKVKRNYTFQLVDLLQAIQNTGTSKTSITFE